MDIHVLTRVGRWCLINPSTRSTGPPGQASREGQQMNTATAVRAAHITDTAELLKQLDELRLTCQRLRQENAELRGSNVMPYRGCRIAEVTIGAVSIPIEYEYQRAEAAVYDADSWRVGPACDAVVSPVRAYLGGAWNALQDVREKLTDESLQQTILDQLEAA